jgi:hypothetical protein
VEYKVRHCPECNKEFPVPEDLEECICMYCGAKFRTQPEQEEIVAPVMEELLSAYQRAMSGINILYEEYEKMLPQFTSQGYSPSFQEYTGKARSVLIPADRYALISREAEERVVREITEALLAFVESKVPSHQGLFARNAAARRIDQFRFFLAVYLVPMLGHVRLGISEMLADRILNEWKKRYPGFEFKKATFEDLEEGFKRKGLCFITSAVCETLNKPDDCYELFRFRQFRDEYLAGTEEGKGLIEQYYRIAPVIVTYINLYSDAAERYRSIWEKYLLPCLKDLEEDRQEECRKRYTEMVERLAAKLPVPYT